ncbi:hypothetical protein K469DRAFT_515660, partial [Zopfia rhizophila CBS 207.26]
EGNYFETQIFTSHRFDTLLEDTCRDPLSDVEPANLVMPFFKTMHALERYAPGIEPDPGTFVCRSCQVDQHSMDGLNMHVVKCRRKYVMDLVEQEWKNLLDARKATPCD